VLGRRMHVNSTWVTCERCPRIYLIATTSLKNHRGLCSSCAQIKRRDATRLPRMIEVKCRDCKVKYEIKRVSLKYHRGQCQPCARSEWRAGVVFQRDPAGRWAGII
jgi:hypothetical protein